jgi:hypothetical protein
MRLKNFSQNEKNGARQKGIGKGRRGENGMGLSMSLGLLLFPVHMQEIL